MPVFLSIMSMIFALTSFFIEGVIGVAAVVISTMLICTAIISVEIRKLRPLGGGESDES